MPPTHLEARRPACCSGAASTSPKPTPLGALHWSRLPQVLAVTPPQATHFAPSVEPPSSHHPRFTASCTDAACATRGAATPAPSTAAAPAGPPLVPRAGFSLLAEDLSDDSDDEVDPIAQAPHPNAVMTGQRPAHLPCTPRDGGVITPSAAHHMPHPVLGSGAILHGGLSRGIDLLAESPNAADTPSACDGAGSSRGGAVTSQAERPSATCSAKRRKLRRVVVSDESDADEAQAQAAEWSHAHPPPAARGRATSPRAAHAHATAYPSASLLVEDLLDDSDEQPPTHGVEEAGGGEEWLPCEFCEVAQPMARLEAHQWACPQRPCANVAAGARDTGAAARWHSRWTSAAATVRIDDDIEELSSSDDGIAATPPPRRPPSAAPAGRCGGASCAPPPTAHDEQLMRLFPHFTSLKMIALRGEAPLVDYLGQFEDEPSAGWAPRAASVAAETLGAGVFGEKQKRKGKAGAAKPVKPKQVWRSRNGKNVYFDKSGKKLSGKKAYTQSQKEKVAVV
ncbi:hypothetical protein AB1Y20_000512 [Prymnesium parvum]|uniref:Uncharacterized protein n=1 Tax=Prymnesium parvum TaxID=97485 RepID=A0AB34K8I0_PRYPA